MRFSTLLYSSSAIVVFALVGAGALVDAADGAVASAALAASAEVEPALLARSDQGESAGVLCVYILRFSGSLLEPDSGVPLAGLLTLFLPYPRVTLPPPPTQPHLPRVANQGFQTLRQAPHQIEDPNLTRGNAPGQGQSQSFAASRLVRP